MVVSQNQNYGANVMKVMKKFILACGLLAFPAVAHAQAANPAATPAPFEAKAVPAPAPATPTADAPVATAPTDGEAKAAAPAASKDGSLPGYTPMKPTTGVGMPTDRGVDFQDQYSDLGARAKWINNAILLPIITVISLFVLGLLLWVIVRYNRRANPTPSKTTHNTFIEVVWTLVPVLILLGIAYPSLDLLARQFKPAPKEAVTVKVTGYQWYWGYSYPDHGGFEVVSNMLQEKADVKPGDRFRTDNDGPAQLAVDNRMVVPAGVPIRLQTTAADVIHAFAVPSLWFKLDAVPGRLNEKQLIINKPGVYFGQCSELCGARHGYMPIAIEALPPAQFAAWVQAKGGQIPGNTAAAPAPAAPAGAPATDNKAAAAPAAAVSAN
jgi:cytochrome c oxidase subunit 2